MRNIDNYSIDNDCVCLVAYVMLWEPKVAEIKHDYRVSGLQDH